MAAAERRPHMSEPRIVEDADPDEAFALLGNETRLAIVRSLWEADGHEASFSDLREAVGMRDSGQFNYHLGKLVDRFVEQSESDTYRLTLAGQRVYGAVLAGLYTQEGSVEDRRLEAPCEACGGDRTFAYDGQQMDVSCVDCGLGTFVPVPPGVFSGYPVEEWPTVADRYVRGTLRRLDDGFCPFCEGRVTATVEPEIGTREPDADPPAEYEAFPSVRYECERCAERFSADLGSALAAHPAVVSFHHDHGVDVREAPLTRVQAVDESEAWVRERDPVEAAVRYEADDECLTLVVDATATVTETYRE
jgi:DNA-binding transcriptional ArsR family regulator